MLFEEKKKKFKNTLYRILYYIYYNVYFQDSAAMVLYSYNASNCNKDVFYILGCRLLISRSYKVMDNMLVYLNRHHAM